MLSRLKKKLSNVRLVDQPAQLILERIDNNALGEVRIFFPDRGLEAPLQTAIDSARFLHFFTKTGAYRNRRLATDWASRRVDGKTLHRKSWI